MKSRIQKLAVSVSDQTTRTIILTIVMSLFVLIAGAPNASGGVGG